MTPLEETYSGRFFRTRHKLSWRAPHICGVINDIFSPKSVIDVGCAIGDLVEGFVDLDIEAYGIEGSKEVLPYLVQIPTLPSSRFIEGFNELTLRVLIRDLRKPLAIRESVKFDLVTCFEVAEHIEPEHADQFMDNITSLSDKILMSYAEPGQKGHSHVNCQPFDYWFDKFFAENYFYSHSIVEAVQKGLEPWKKKDGIKALFKHHLVYFERWPK